MDLCVYLTDRKGETECVCVCLCKNWCLIGHSLFCDSVNWLQLSRVRVVLIEIQCYLSSDYYDDNYHYY